ncbi:MAG: VOC family protein [Oligoflexales bacterium]
MKLKMLVPMLAVEDIRIAHKFYVQLGFEICSPVEKIEEWCWCNLKKDQVQVMLSQTKFGHMRPQKRISESEHYFSCCLYFYPNNVETLYEHYKKIGIKVSELHTTFYGMKEFSLHDPDGHLLSFGQDNK